MLDRLNAKLEKVKIRQKGNRLYLRATLPPKTGEGTWKQTDVRTGCPATDDGYKAAYAKAQKLESDLIFERFRWEDWGETSPEQTAIADWIDKFEKAYWQETEKNKSQEGRFHRDYLTHYNRLPQDEPITLESLRRILIQFPPQSRTRKAAHGAYSRLARFAGIPLPPEWARLKGTYKPKGDRKIPSDDEILATWERLKGPWKWAYGIFACYGIRNHELMHLDFSDYPALHIGPNTKTGERLAYPLHPDWAALMQCDKINPPAITAEDNREIGNAVGKAFRRLEVGHTPYALRDCYAIRASVLGISPAIVVKWMGHSLSTHYGHYLKWIEKTDFDKVWDGLK